MSSYHVDTTVHGPWSLQVSRQFWEGFAPAALQTGQQTEGLRTTFRSERDWQRVETEVRQDGDTAHISVTGDGDLPAAAAQVARFLALDIDARAWPDVAQRDPVIASAQARLPGLRPCGFHSPYEAAVWSVFSQRVRIVEAARIRDWVIRHHGDHGAFPAPAVLRNLDLDLPGRKTEYLHAVAEAALDGQLNGELLRSMPSEKAIATVREVKGLGPFAAELVVIRGANAPDVAPTQERRLDAEVAACYGPDRTLAQVSPAWRPFRTWASVYLRCLRELRP